jgi:hypothetical protein
MPNLFGIDIAGIINKEMGPLLLPVVLIKSVKGTRTTGNLSGGVQPISTSYNARGFISDYTDREVDGTLVVTGDRKVCILGASISSSKIPQGNDKVTVEGYTYKIVRVKRDPAAATYTCQVRGPANA